MNIVFPYVLARYISLIFQNMKIIQNISNPNSNRTENIMDGKELIHTIVKSYYQVRLLNTYIHDVHLFICIISFILFFDIFLITYTL